MRRRNPAPDEQQHREALLRPPEKKFKESFRDFFWDPKQKTCLTRTPMNWLSITIYYIIFLFFTFLLFYISLYVALNLPGGSKDQPHYILEHSPTGNTPALNYFPREKYGNLIRLSDNKSYSRYVRSISDELDKYKNLSKRFNTSEFGECANPPYGYDQNSPCVFFKLNRLLLWRPQPYTKEDNLPEFLPKNIKDSIKNSSIPRIWLSCTEKEGKNSDEIEPNFFQLQGPKGFDVSAYPYVRQKDFVDPIVALKLNSLPQKKILYSILCSAWSKYNNPKKSLVEINYYFE